MTSLRTAWTRSGPVLSCLFGSLTLFTTALPLAARASQDVTSEVENGEPGMGLRASQAIKPGKAYLRILSYNVKGLPSLINSYKKSRFPIIGKMLKERRDKGTAPDVVLVQEAFIDPSIAIQGYSGYPYVANGPGKKGIDYDGSKYKKLLRSGIFMMSNLPIRKQQIMTFPKSSCGTFDCFANKGAQMITVRPKGVPFDISILNTHTQAEKGYDHIRMNQFAWLNYFARSTVNYNDPYRAMIFAGDFNSKPMNPSFNYFRDLAAVTNVGQECTSPQSHCETIKGTKPGWLCEDAVDQFFYASGRQVRIRPITVERNFTETHKGKTLSDHLGYETLFEISWK